MANSDYVEDGADFKGFILLNNTKQHFVANKERIKCRPVIEVPDEPEGRLIHRLAFTDKNEDYHATAMESEIDDVLDTVENLLVSQYLHDHAGWYDVYGSEYRVRWDQNDGGNASGKWIHVASVELPDYRESKFLLRADCIGRHTGGTFNSPQKIFVVVSTNSSGVINTKGVYMDTYMSAGDVPYRDIRLLRNGHTFDLYVQMDDSWRRVPVDLHVMTTSVETHNILDGSINWISDLPAADEEITQNIYNRFSTRLGVGANPEHPLDVSGLGRFRDDLQVDGDVIINSLKAPTGTTLTLKIDDQGQIFAE